MLTAKRQARGGSLVLDGPFSGAQVPRRDRRFSTVYPLPDCFHRHSHS